MGKKKKKTELEDLRGFKQMPCFYHNLPFMFPLFINEKKKKPESKITCIVTEKYCWFLQHSRLKCDHQTHAKDLKCRFVYPSAVICLKSY